MVRILGIKNIDVRSSEDLILLHASCLPNKQEVEFLAKMLL